MLRKVTVEKRRNKSISSQQELQTNVRRLSSLRDRLRGTALTTYTLILNCADLVSTLQGQVVFKSVCKKFVKEDGLLKL